MERELTEMVEYASVYIVNQLLLAHQKDHQTDRTQPDRVIVVVEFEPTAEHSALGVNGSLSGEGAAIGTDL